MILERKRVLVTGAAGFIGSHLVEGLLAAGCGVRAFVHYNALNSWGWIDTFAKTVRDSIEIFPGDIRDSHRVREAAKGIDIVFHLAALIAIPYSYEAPESYIDTNVKGALNVLQAARDLGTPRVLMTSTSEVYGTARYVPIDEQHPFQGQSPYSASKIAADRLAESYYRSFDLPVTIVRPFNTYGPRQSARAIIPSVIVQLLGGSESLNVGSLHPTRDFNYVDDTVAGFIEIAKSDRAIGQEINIASQRELSIGDLVRAISVQLDRTPRLVTEPQRVRPERSEVERLLGSNAKITALTAWRPATSLEQGIAHTIEWFRKADNLGRYKNAVYNL